VGGHCGAPHVARVRLETGVAVFWVVLAAGIAVNAARLRLWEPAGPGSGFMPMVAALVIAAAGIGLVVRAFASRGRRPFWPGRAARIRVVAVCAGLAAMAVAMPRLGFVPTSLFAMGFLLRVIERRSWTWVVGTAVVTTVVLYVLFDRLLQMALPRGPLGF
jgi:putative tricarboxylic transport membrane protein